MDRKHATRTHVGIGAFVTVFALLACDDDSATEPDTLERPTYTIVDDEVWAGSEFAIEWSGGELAPTAVYIEALRVPLTVTDSGRGYVPVPNDVRGPMTVRIVTGEHEDTVGTVRVLGFWHRTTDAPFFNWGFARSVDGVASIVASSATWVGSTPGPSDSAYAAELRLPEATVRRLAPPTYRGNAAPGRTPDPDRMILSLFDDWDDGSSVIEEWRIAPNAELLRTDTLPVQYEVVQQLNDTLYMGLSSYWRDTWVIADSTYRVSSTWDSEGPEARPSPDYEWVVPRTPYDTVQVVSTRTGSTAFSVPTLVPYAIAYTPTSDTVFLAGLVLGGMGMDSLFSYSIADGRRLNQRGLPELPFQSYDMVADPERPLLYILWKTSTTVGMLVIDRRTMEIVAAPTMPLPALDHDFVLWLPVAAIDEDYIYLVDGTEVFGIDRPTGEP